jgi:hypothetical protein
MPKASASSRETRAAADDVALATAQMVDDWLTLGDERAADALKSIVERADWRKLDPDNAKLVLHLLAITGAIKAEDIVDERAFVREESALEEIYALLYGDGCALDSDVASKLVGSLRENKTGHHAPAARVLELSKCAIDLLRRAHEHDNFDPHEAMLKILGEAIGLVYIEGAVVDAIIVAAFAATDKEALDQLVAPALQALEHDLDSPESGRSDATPFEVEGDEHESGCTMLVDGSCDCKVDESALPTPAKVAASLGETAESDPPHVALQREMLMSVVDRALAIGDGLPIDKMLAERFEDTAWDDDDIRAIAWEFVQRCPAKLLPDVVVESVRTLKSSEELFAEMQAEEAKSKEERLEEAKARAAEAKAKAAAARAELDALCERDRRGQEFAEIIAGLPAEQVRELLDEAKRRAAASSAEAA